MPKFSMKVMWSDEDGGFIATCPELPGVSAGGATPGDAISELQVAMELAIETFEAKGWPLPEPAVEQPFSGQFRLRVPKSVHRWLSEQAEVEGVSLNSFVVGIISRARGGSEAVAVVINAPQHTPALARGALGSSIHSVIRYQAMDTNDSMGGARAPGFHFLYGATNVPGELTIVPINPRKERTHGTASMVADLLASTD